MSMESEMLVKDLVKELRKTRELNERKLNSEIAGRDRVNISLSHYEALKNRIIQLEEENNKLKDSSAHATKLFAKIGIPVDVLERIDISDVVVDTHVNPINHTIRYHVSFSVRKEEVV